jgi:hypothetical protein
MSTTGDDFLSCSMGFRVFFLCIEGRCSFFFMGCFFSLFDWGRSRFFFFFLLVWVLWVSFSFLPIGMCVIAPLLASSLAIVIFFFFVAFYRLPTWWLWVAIKGCCCCCCVFFFCFVGWMG